MIKNYFKTALRNFWGNKIFSLINIVGLSIGISAALVIFLIAYYELSFDKFEKDRDRVYRVTLDATFNGTEGHSAAVPAPLFTAIQNEVTGVEFTIPVFQFQGDATAKVSIMEENAGKPVIYKKQTDICFTNPQYLRVLNYQWIAGSPNGALKDPFKVVLTESRANQYFQGITASDIIGKQITYNDITTTVSGIVKDLNEHTAFSSREFISLPTISKTGLQKNFMMDVWDDWMAYSQLYIKLSPGITAAQTELQLKNISKKYNAGLNKNPKNKIAYHLQPLNDLHFNRVYQGFNQRIADKATLYGLFAIAAFLLMLGCINFINLTTANASRRAKEIGIRKTMGSSKANIMFQFLGETFLVTAISTMVSIAIMPLLLKAFADFIPQGLSVNLFHQPYLIFFLIILIVVVGVLSGLYPAFVLSGYKTVLVLKNQAFTGLGQTRNAWVRKTLTVSQFVIAQFFVIATLMVSKQINYSINSDMGFQKDAIVNFELPRDTVASHGARLLNQIKSLAGVEVAATGFFAPADEGVAFTNLSYNNGKEEIKPNTQIRWGDPNFINVYQIKIIAGRNVMPSDTINEFLVNESYAHAIGIQRPELAINKLLRWNGKNVPIVGVMKDFHDQSFRSLISPVVFGGSNGSIFHVRLKPNNAGGTMWLHTIADIERAYRQIYPDEEFNYHFFDETIAKLYESEQHTAGLLKWATGLAIFISCLGLLGLVIYTTNTRTKEIGVRKVLGATVINIIGVLSKDFILLVFIAFLIAAPFAWWAVYAWLQGYAYRTAMSWWVFSLSGAVMLLITCVLLSLQTIKTALANPVKSLRSE